VDEARTRIGNGGKPALMCRTGERVLAVPLPRVVETMRPLACEPFAGGPDFLIGLARIRDEVVPVIDAGVLLGATPARAARFVTLRVPAENPAGTTGPDGREHVVALAVEAVIGVHELDAAALSNLPPVLGFLPEGAVSAVGALDGRLLLVLGDSHLVPDSVWSDLDRGVTVP
jgi:purine-binding chemotaxis protein CheW